MKKYIKVFLMYFGVLLGITFIIVAIIIGFFIAMGFSFDNFDDPQILIPFLLTVIPLSIVALIAITFIAIIFTGMIYDIFTKSYIGEEWNFKSSFKYVKSKFWTIFLAGFLCYFILIGGVLMCCIGIFPMMALVSLVIPAIIYEKESATSAISRSFKLVSYSFWKVFGSVILFVIIIQAISMVFQLVFQFIPPMIESLGNGTNIPLIIFISFLSIITYLLYLAYSVLASALSAAFYVLIFFNQKIKHENFGVEMLAESITSDQVSEDKTKK